MSDLAPVRRPLCDQQETIDGSPAGPVLRCHLPAGHRSEEHYDRTFGLVWRRIGPGPRGPAPDLLITDDTAQPTAVPRPRTGD